MTFNLRGLRLVTAQKNPFFASVLFSLKLEINNDIPTAATDGKRIMFNESFMDSLTKDERVGVLTHELLHVVFLHMSRRKTRNPQLWNVAADYVINLVIRANGLVLPDNCLYDIQYTDMTTEEVYDKLIQDGKVGQSPDFNDIIESASEDELREIADIIKSASQQFGHTVKGMDRLFNSLHEPEIDWVTLLHNFVIRDMSDFRGYDRRFISRGEYFDTLDSEKLKLVVGVDTSGSIDDTLIGDFLGEVNSLVQLYDVDARYFWFDTKHTEFELSDPRPVGGGGTSVTTLLSDEDLIDYDCVVILTDGYLDKIDDPVGDRSILYLTPSYVIKFTNKLSC